MGTVKGTAIVVTILWLLGVFVVGLYWMGKEYALIEKDNGNGTVTFRDGPDHATQTHGEFFAEAVKNSFIVVLFFPTLPYVVVMAVLGVVWLATRRTHRGEKPEGWAESGDGSSMAERLAKMKNKPPNPR